MRKGLKQLKELFRAQIQNLYPLPQKLSEFFIFFPKVFRIFKNGHL